MLGTRSLAPRMALRSLAGAALLVVAGALAPAASASIEDADYAALDVRIVDTKGGATDAPEFGYYTGPNILLAHRGDGDADVPLRLVRVLEIGNFVPETRRAPCTVTLRTGKTIALEIDHVEGQRLLGGATEFGEFRIRMEKIRRIEFVRFSQPPSS